MRWWAPLALSGVLLSFPVMAVSDIMGSATVIDGDTIVNLPEYDVSLGWLIMRPFFLPRQAPYFHLREPSRSSWG